MADTLTREQELMRQRNELALALDQFFYDLRYTAPEAVGHRLNELGSRITPVMNEFSHQSGSATDGRLTFADGES